MFKKHIEYLKNKNKKISTTVWTIMFFQGFTTSSLRLYRSEGRLTFTQVTMIFALEISLSFWCPRGSKYLLFTIKFVFDPTVSVGSEEGQIPEIVIVTILAAAEAGFPALCPRGELLGRISQPKSWLAAKGSGLAQVSCLTNPVFNLGWAKNVSGFSVCSDNEP